MNCGNPCRSSTGVMSSTMLDQVYGIKQRIIAKRVGYSQGYISKLVTAAEQSPVLRSFLSRGSLTLGAGVRTVQRSKTTTSAIWRRGTPCCMP